MHTELYGFVPFGARDKYQHGKGNMLIKLAGLTINEAKGREIDLSALVTFLAEAVLLPAVFTQSTLSLQQSAPDCMTASIKDAGKTVSGKFYFDKYYQIYQFRTNDRYYAATNKEAQKLPWSAYYDRYREMGGLRIPTVLRAAWHLADGVDYEYFRAGIKEIKYDIKV
nr:DUF6544 family protein [uncultured Pontibacter sp.]